MIWSLNTGLTCISNGLRKLARVLTCKVPNTTIAEFANTVDPDETAHNEPSHLDLQCLPSSLLIFQHNSGYIQSFSKICRRNFAVCFFGSLRVKIWIQNSSLI